MNVLIAKWISHKDVTMRDLALASVAEREAFFEWLSPANEEVVRGQWNDWLNSSERSRRVFV